MTANFDLDCGLWPGKCIIGVRGVERSWASKSIRALLLFLARYASSDEQA